METYEDALRLASIIGGDELVAATREALPEHLEEYEDLHGGDPDSLPDDQIPVDAWRWSLISGLDETGLGGSFDWTEQAAEILQILIRIAPTAELRAALEALSIPLALDDLLAAVESAGHGLIDIDTGADHLIETFVPLEHVEFARASLSSPTWRRSLGHYFDDGPSEPEPGGSLRAGGRTLVDEPSVDPPGRSWHEPDEPDEPEEGDEGYAPYSRLHRVFFRQPADPADYRAWKTRMRGGSSLMDTSMVFAESSAFRDRHLALSDEEFVERVYLDALDRRPDRGGLTHWATQLGQGMPRGQFMLILSDSSEFRRRYPNG